MQRLHERCAIASIRPQPGVRGRQAIECPARKRTAANFFPEASSRWLRSLLGRIVIGTSSSLETPQEVRGSAWIDVIGLRRGSGVVGAARAIWIACHESPRDSGSNRTIRFISKFDQRPGIDSVKRPPSSAMACHFHAKRVLEKPRHHGSLGADHVRRIFNQVGLWKRDRRM